MNELFTLQRQLADAVRYPQLETPSGVSVDRLSVYRDLVINNVSNFVCSTYPILRQICTPSVFDQKIVHFFQQTQLDSPYFVDIPKYFLDWLAGNTFDLPPFALELAHYEWLELDIFKRIQSEATKADNQNQVHFGSELLSKDAALTLSSLVEVVAYQYPVHQLSIHNQPSTPPQEATFLALYRGNDEQVHFLQLDALSTATMQLLLQQPGNHLQYIVQTLQSLVPGLPKSELNNGLTELLKKLYSCGIVRFN